MILKQKLKLSRIVALCFISLMLGMPNLSYSHEKVPLPLPSQGCSFSGWFTQSKDVEGLVVGQPTRHDGSFSPIEERILTFIETFKAEFPQINVHRINEMYSSKDAMQALIKSGVKKMQRRDKKLLDSTAATLLLQEFLQHRI